MTNNTIIALAVLENRLMTKNQLVDVINKTGDVPFHSFNEWKARGFKVKKGEHGVFKTKLWMKTNYSEDELKKMKKESNWFYLQLTSLFSREQVELAKEEKKFPLSEKTVKELAENGVSLKEKTAKKQIAKQTSKKVDTKKANSERAAKAVMNEFDKTAKKATAKAVNVVSKKETAKAVQPNANSQKAKAVKTTKKATTKKTEIGKMTANIDHGTEIIRIDLTKADGTYAWIEMPKDFYLGLKKTEKKRLETLWGLN